MIEYLGQFFTELLRKEGTMRQLKGFFDEDTDYIKRKQALLDGVARFLTLADYRQVEPPILEYLSTFCEGGLSSADMFKAMDTDGELLAVCPDLTLSLQRFIANQPLEQKLPLRVFYSGKTYSLRDVASRGRAFDQIGAELINCNGLAADAEAITLAIESVLFTGINGFIVELSMPSFMDALLSELKLCPQDYALVRENVNKKNTFSIRKNKLLSEEAYTKVAALFDAVPLLFGEVTPVLNSALALAQRYNCRVAIEKLNYLQGLCTLLNESGYSEYLFMDLAACPKGYYDGIVFQGMTAAVGEPLFFGGRYDGIFRNASGNAVPAVGFTIALKTILSHALPVAKVHEETPIYVACDEQSLVTLGNIVRGWLKEGKKVVSYFVMSKEQFDEIALIDGAQRCYVTNNVPKRY